MFKVRVFLAAAILAASLSGSVLASTDTFTITVTCRYLSINLRTYDDAGDYTTWAVGLVNEGNAATMGEEDGILVVNGSNVAIDLGAWVSGQAADWSNGATADEDVYVLELKAFDSSQATPDLSTDTTVVAADAEVSRDTFKASLAEETDQWVYSQFTVPTSSTTGSQQSITVTIMASPS